MPSGEKQPPASAKKIVLRDLLSETNNFASNALNKSPLKEKGSFPVTPKLSGTKREESSSPSTPHSHQYGSSNGHLVYVRRKLDTEPSKVCLETEEQNDHLYLRNSLKDHSSEIKSAGVHETNLSEVPTQLLSPTSLISLVPEPPSYASKRENFMAALLTDERRVSPAPQSEAQSEGEGYWKDRFIRLQMSLKNFDQYNQEKYIQSLRSLSAAGRSLHAVELEKRAIQLLLDEGRELQKMKILNVLGKPLSDSQTGLCYQAFSPELLASEK